MSSKKEQAALVALFNSFNPSRRLTAFEQLSDGKILLEIMRKIDAVHFKSIPARTIASSSSNDNWVLKMNTLKRLYRLLLSFPLPPPNPSSLSLSTLPEPDFAAIARTPITRDGLEGLLQVSRLCLSLSVWAPGNEKVIAKISDLGEVHMTQLMRSIEEVMATLPTSEQDGKSNSSPDKSSRNISPPPTGLRAERDKLLQENDELREKCDTLIAQVAEMSINVEEAMTERDDAVARFQREATVSSTKGQSPSDLDDLRNDLLKAEDHLARTESQLEQKVAIIAELTKQVEAFRIKAGEASKLKDQLDEYRHAADKLQKSENVIEKYKKKLEDSAGLRRQIKKLEDENAQLLEAKSTLESEIKRADSSKTLLDSYKVQVTQLATQMRTQQDEITQLQVQLEIAHADLDTRIQSHERDLEELHLHQAKARETKLSDSPVLDQSSSDDENGVGNASLGEELGAMSISGPTETKTSSKLQLQTLQRELEVVKAVSKDGSHGTALETLLADANRARDRYQADYLEAHRTALRAQANLEQLRSGRDGDDSLSLAALKQRLEEVVQENDTLSKAKVELELSVEKFEQDLKTTQVDLSLVGQDQKSQVEAVRRAVANENQQLVSKVASLKEEVASLKEKDRMHLEEIKRLLMEKVDLQSTGITQREKALDREKELCDLRASLAKSGVDPDTQIKLIRLHTQNDELSAEIRNLENKLIKAKDFIKNQDALFRADHAKSNESALSGSQPDQATQISQLKAELLKTRQATAALEQRYKLEHQLMLSAWHELGSRTVRDHIGQAGVRKTVKRPEPTSWLGRQRKHQEEASFVR